MILEGGGGGGGSFLTAPSISFASGASGFSAEVDTSVSSCFEAGELLMMLPDLYALKTLPIKVDVGSVFVIDRVASVPSIAWP